MGDLVVQQQQAQADLLVAASKPGNPVDYIKDLKARAYLNNDWYTSLAAAPVCFELLGSCCLAASTDVAQTTKLTAPASGFRHLKGYTYLSASLIEVANKGHMTFEHAYEDMSVIREQSLATRQTIGELFGILADAKSATTTPMKIKMSDLKRKADECQRRGEKMRKEFDDWLQYVLELHEACVDQSGRSATQFILLESDQKAKQIEADEREVMKKEQKKAAEDMKKTVDEQLELYKKLVKDFPDGNKLMLQQLAMIGAETVAFAVKAFVVAGATNMSPTASIPLAAESMKEGKKDTSDALGGAKDGAETDGEGGKKKKKRFAAVKNDPALGNASLVYKAIESLNNIVNGKDGISWDLVLGNPSHKATGKDEDDQNPASATKKDDKTDQKAGKQTAADSKQDTKSKTNGTTKNDQVGKPPTKTPAKTPSKAASKIRSKTSSTRTPRSSKTKSAASSRDPAKDLGNGQLNIQAVHSLLSSSQKNISSSMSQKKSKAGKKMLSILSEGLQVTEDLQNEREQASNVGKKWTKPTGDKVKQWQETTSKQVTAAKRLKTQAHSSMFGSSVQGAALQGLSSAEEAQIHSRTELNAATVDAARSQLQIVMEGYVTTQESARKMADSAYASQEKLILVRAEIESLKQQKTTLESVRRVLRSCISYLIDLKNNIAELTRFFSGLSNLIGLGMSSAVQNFLDYATEDESRALGRMYGKKVLLDIAQYAMNSAGYFELYVDIAEMYKEVHQKHISEGLNLVYRMSKVSQEDEMKAKTDELSTYSTESQKGIKAIIQKRTDAISAEFGQKALGIKKILDNALLPPPPKDHDHAIHAGARDARHATDQHIANSNPGIKLLGNTAEKRDEVAGLLAQVVDKEAHVREQEHAFEAAQNGEETESDDSGDDGSYDSASESGDSDDERPVMNFDYS